MTENEELNQQLKKNTRIYKNILEMEDLHSGNRPGDIQTLLNAFFFNLEEASPIPHLAWQGATQT